LTIIYFHRIFGNKGYPGLDAEYGPKGQKGSPGIIGIAGKQVMVYQWLYDSKLSLYLD